MKIFSTEELKNTSGWELINMKSLSFAQNIKLFNPQFKIVLIDNQIQLPKCVFEPLKPNECFIFWKSVFIWTSKSIPYKIFQNTVWKYKYQNIIWK